MAVQVSGCASLQPDLHAAHDRSVAFSTLESWVPAAVAAPDTHQTVLPYGRDFVTDSSTHEPDRRGRRSDTLHFVAYQAASIGILYTLPSDVTGWTAERKENYSVGQWWDNIRNPRWDSDNFIFNYVTHPYWGAAYFVRSRERGFDDRASFWYAASLSALYEFGAEALFEEPSIQDLIVTPVGGWLLGRYFMRVRQNILAGDSDRGALPFRQRWILTLTDPLGALNRTVDRWFGLDQRFHLRPFARVRPVTAGGSDDAPIHVEAEQVYGISFSYQW